MSTSLKTWLYVAAAAAVAALGLWGASWIYDAGQTKERAVWLDKEATRAGQLAKDLQAEYERGRAASQRYQLGASALQTNYLNLEGPSHELRRRVSLVLPAAVPTCNRDRVPDAVGSTSQRAGTGADAPGEEHGSAEPGSGRLSRAAVWMWNSALAGADTPAGTCGLADTSSQACAVDSGLTVDDAWDNHTLNAKSCAADRLRFRALIEFITERPAE
jgi:hypothetical protein